jgi:predicted metal-dependent hydrolase
MRRLLQFTLDLFEPEPSSRPAALAPQPLAESEQFRALDPDIQGAAVTELVAKEATLPARPLSEMIAPANFRHPRATRETQLGHAIVAYEFKRGKRRTIGFSVGAEGLVVSAPKWVPLYEVDAALREKSGWIIKKLGETRERHERLESTRIVWKDGTSLPFLGQQIVVVLDPRHGFSAVGAELQSSVAPAVLHTDSPAPTRAPAGQPPLTLQVGLPHSATPEQIRDAVQAWLMRQAKRVFTERLDHYAPLLKVQWRKLSLSSAGTRWGSARIDGAIRLHWRLIHFNQSVIDYVVAHELSHLRVMDHSPRFWDTVRSVVPDYATLRGQLKDEAVPRWP